MKCFILFAALLTLDKEETLKVIEEVRLNRGLALIPRNGISFKATASQLGNPAAADITGSPADISPAIPKPPD